MIQFLIKLILSLFKGTPAPKATPVVGGFEAAFPWIIKWEGSEYEDVPGDNGGATKYGIDASSHPGVDIKGLTLESAKAIYQKEWDGCLSATLPGPLDIVYFNYHVNAGPGRANRLLQMALGVPEDGIIGPFTKSVIARITDAKAVGNKMVDAADLFYESLAKSIAHDAQFLRGWLNRNGDLQKTFLM